MLTDAINIKDAFIINFELNFEVTSFKNYNNQAVLVQCINEIKDYFNKFSIKDSNNKSKNLYYKDFDDKTKSLFDTYLLDLKTIENL